MPLEEMKEYHIFDLVDRFFFILENVMLGGTNTKIATTRFYSMNQVIIIYFFWGANTYRLDALCTKV